MLFGIEADLGNRIVGYLVGDSFAGRGRVRLVADGIEMLVVDTDEKRDSLVAAGRHESGYCGFTISDEQVPELAALPELELYDTETGLLLYRRRRAGSVLERKLFRLETHLLPLWRLDDALERRFLYFYKGLERFGGETSLQVFHINQATSLYASGRLALKTIDHQLSEGFSRVVLLRDPYHELAERLLVLDRMAMVGTQHLGMRDALIYEPAVRFAAGLDFADPATLGRSLRKIPSDVAAILCDPLARQLTCKTPDELPSPTALASSLSALSEFALVGMRARSGEFCDALAELLGIDPQELPDVSEHPRIVELGESLRRSGSVDSIVGVDAAIFSAVEEAFEKADSVDDG